MLGCGATADSVGLRALNRRDRIIAEAQERLLGPDGKLHPAEYTVTELALVETTDDNPTKVQHCIVIYFKTFKNKSTFVKYN